MSWSVSYIGKPANIIAALQKESERLTGPCKTEFDAALPNLINLVEQNHNSDEQYTPVLQLTANGHAYFKQDGSLGNRTCNVSLAQSPGTLV